MLRIMRKCAVNIISNLQLYITTSKQFFAVINDTAQFTVKYINLTNVVFHMPLQILSMTVINVINLRDLSI